MLASRLLPIRDEPAVASRWGPLEPGEMDESVGDERTLVIEVDDVVGAIQTRRTKTRCPATRRASR
jgi:hypothetical protein